MKYSVRSVQSYPAYSVVTLRPKEGGGMWFEPGQYVTISADGILATPTRCFSIISSPHDIDLQLAFRVSGGVTRAVSQLHITDRVSVQGPFGDFVIGHSNRPIVMIASGIGITPFLSMLRQLATEKSRRQLVLLTTNRSVASIPFHNEIRSLIAQMPNAQVGSFVGDGDEGVISGQIDEAVLRKAHAVVGDDAEFYLCGPANFSERTMRALREIGIPDEQVITEAFSRATKSPATTFLIRNVVMGSALGFASIAALITGVDMIATHNKAEAAYAKTHPNVLSAAKVSATTNDGSATSGTSTTPTPSSSASTATAPSYTKQPIQSYNTPSTNYYYSPPVSSGS